MNARQEQQIIVMKTQRAQTPPDHIHVLAIPDIAVMDGVAMVCTNFLCQSTFEFFN